MHGVLVGKASPVIARYAHLTGTRSCARYDLGRAHRYGATLAASRNTARYRTSGASGASPSSRSSGAASGPGSSGTSGASISGAGYPGPATAAAVIGTSRTGRSQLRAPISTAPSKEAQASQDVHGRQSRLS